MQINTELDVSLLVTNMIAEADEKKPPVGQGGRDYEEHINNILKKHGKADADATTAGSSADAPDAQFNHGGKKHNLEIKADSKAMFGQLELKHDGEKWDFSEKSKAKYPETHKQMVKSGFLKKINTQWGKPTGKYEDDLKMGNVYHTVDNADPIKAHYGKDRKTDYIQIGGGHGFYHTGNDAAKLGSPELNGKTQLRARMKARGRDKDGNRTYGALVVMALKDAQKSHHDLEKEIHKEWIDYVLNGPKVISEGYNNNRTGFRKRAREDDEYHTPDPVTRTHKIGFHVSKDGVEHHHRTVTITNSTKSEEEAKQVARAHLERQGYKIHEETEIDEARMSAAVKLQRAFEREQQKSAASRERAKELLQPKKEEPKKVEEGTGSLKPGWMLKKDPELAKKLKAKIDLAKKRQASYGNPDAGKSVKEEVAVNNVSSGAIAGTQGDAGKKSVMTKPPMKRQLKSFKEGCDCWKGYKRKPGTKPCAPGSCVKEDNELDEAAIDAKGHKSSTGGLTQKGVDAYRRANPGSKLQTAVTTKPSKLKPGSKDAKRRKSFCARMSGVSGPMKDENGKPTRKALALRKWNC